MKHPLLLPALAFALGIALGWQQTVSLTILFPSLATLFIATMLLPRWRSHLLLPLFFVAGWTHLCSRTQIVSPIDIRLHVGDRPLLVSVRGTLAESPVLRVSGDESDKNPRWRAMIDLREIKTENDFLPARGRLISFTPGNPPTNLFAGSIVEVFGVIRQPDAAPFPGLFDYREKLRRQGIHFQIETEGESDWSILSQPMRRPLRETFRAFC